MGKDDGERGRTFVTLHLLLEFMLKIQLELFLVMHGANFIFSSRFQWESSNDRSSWKKQWTWSCSIRQYTLSSHQLSPCQARKCVSGHMVFSQCAIRWALLLYQLHQEVSLRTSTPISILEAFGLSLCQDINHFDWWLSWVYFQGYARKIFWNWSQFPTFIAAGI